MKPALLTKIGITYYQKSPLQVLLSILGIGLGVALVVSIDIANSSVERSFQLSTENLTGKATHQIVGTYGDIDQSIYIKLRTELGIRPSAPVIVGNGLVKELDQKRIQLLGIDPLAEKGFLHYNTEAGQGLNDMIVETMTTPNHVLIFDTLALESGLHVGDTLTLTFGKKEISVTVGGVIRQGEQANSVASSLLTMDISTAQEILGKKDRISHIDLILDEQEQSTIERIKKVLPEHYQLIPAGQRRTAVRQMSESFELNLQAFSLLALLMGMFLIYNTITFSVIQRRQLFGVLRTLGVTRGELLTLILKETTLIALIGTILGLVLGMLLGIITVRMVSQTVHTLYFTLVENTFYIAPLQLLKAFILGMAVSVASAIFPALEVNRIQPAEAVIRSKIESKIASWLPVFIGVGILLIALGCGAILVSSKRVIWGFAGTAGIVFGFAFFVPSLIYLFSYVMSPVAAMVFGITGKMAIRNIPRTISRTGVSVAALMVAVCVYIGVGLMIASFKGSLVEWIENQFRGEIRMTSSNALDRILKPELIDAVHEFPSVAYINRISTNMIKTGEYMHTAIFATNQNIRDYRWIALSVPARQVQELFLKGYIFVSETFAWRHDIDISKNRKIVLETPSGPHEFTVGGIFSDFFLRGGRLVMELAVYQKLWKDNSITNIEIFLDPDADTGHFADQIERRFPEEHIGMIFRQEIRKRILKIFDNTFAITVALQLLSAFVAFIGILNTILALTYERLGEIGILRANGLTIPQLWRLVMIESGAMGVYASVLAIPLGTILAWILIAVINRRSFGWTLQIQFQIHYILQAVFLSLLAALLAGMYPAFKVGRLNIIDAIRAE